MKALAAAVLATFVGAAAPATGPSPIASPSAAPSTAPIGDPTRGARVFADNCAICHGEDAHGGAFAPWIAGKDADLVARKVRDPGAASDMPKLPLGDQEIADVAAYVASLR